MLEPTEHSTMTICLPVMSTEALLLYQTMLFWHTENYTVKNTHVCCAVCVKSTVMSETVHVMPSGNCEVEMTLLLERQMKNIWTGVSVPTEHRQTTTDLSAISTEALSQYQTDLFLHTECYLSKIHDLFSTGSDLIVTTFPSAVAVNLTSPAVLMYGLLPV